MRGRIRDKNDHLHRIFSPFHIQRCCEGSSLSLGTITSPGGNETGQVLLHDIDVRGESKLFGHVGFVLWRVITECNEPESDEVLRKVSRSRDLVADVTDGSACRLNVGTLAARRVLEKDDIPRIGGVRSDDQGIA